MTAGAGVIAFAVEDTFRTLPDVPTWIEPGENISVNTLSVDNALQRKRNTDDPRPSGSRRGNFEGALNITFSMTSTGFHDLIFADGGTTLASSSALAPTAGWYVSADVPGSGSTQDRLLSGARVESATISYQQGEDITVDLTIVYADEPDPTGTYADVPTTADIDRQAKDDIATFHGFDIDVDGATVQDPQSAEISLAGLSQFRRSNDIHPTEAVVSGYEPTLNLDAIVLDDSRRSLAYGSASATDPLSTVDETTATVTIDNPSGTLTTYDITGVQPTSYEWADLFSADTELSDPLEAHFTNIEAV